MQTILSKKTPDNYLNKNISYLIKKYQIDTQVLAKCTGLSSATIASLRSRASNPTVLTLKPIADFFNVTIDELIATDCSSIQKSNSENASLIISVPLFNLSAIDNRQSKKLKPLEYINTNNTISQNCYALRLESEVLMPSYQKGTVLIIEPDRCVEDGNLVVVCINNSKPSYRQVFIDGDEYFFKPVNPEFGTMQYADSYDIHGVIVRAIYDLGTTP